MHRLHFSNENTLYLLLNIIGHDVIHDYAVSPERWNKNQILIKQFYDDYVTFSNPLNVSVGGGGTPTQTQTQTQTRVIEQSSVFDRIPKENKKNSKDNHAQLVGSMMKI